MEPRCFSCICASCANEDGCTSRGCYGDEKRDTFECEDVMWECPLTRDPEDSDDVQSYAFWLGGTDTTNAALAQYDLLRNRVMANSGGDMKCRARQQ